MQRNYHRLGLATVLVVARLAAGELKVEPNRLSAPAGPEAASREATNYVSAGIASVNNQEWVFAISNFTKAVVLQPGDAIVFHLRGCAFLMSGDSGKAIDDLSMSIHLNPLDAGVYVSRARAYRTVGEVKKELADLDRCLQLEPNNLMARKNRASNYQAAGDLVRALEDLNHALLCAPTDAQAMVMRGHTRRLNGQFDDAVQDCREAIRLDSQNPEAFNELGWLRATCAVEVFRRSQEAVELATKACELSKWGCWQYVDTLAAAYAGIGDFEKAAHYQKLALKMCRTAGADQREMESRLLLYEKRFPFRDGVGKGLGLTNHTGSRRE